MAGSMKANTAICLSILQVLGVDQVLDILLVNVLE